MMQIKNLKAGWLFITDAGLKLMAGQVASVEKLTPQTEMLIARGYVALMDTPEGKSSQSTKADIEHDFTPIIAGYQALNTNESIKFIKKCEDLSLLRAILKKEGRGTVLDDLNARIEELESLTK